MASSSPPGSARTGPGRVLIAVYALFALAASARAGVQIATKFGNAPVAYVLSAFAAGVYILATVTLAVGSPAARRIAVLSCSVELAGVLAFGTWWIPLLIVLGLWRHVRHHWPLSYEPPLWSVVFPLGMYSVATLAYGQAAHLPFMPPLAHVMLWVAVAAWVLVAATFAARLARLPGTPNSGTSPERKQP